jgi:hypothetical protein
MSAADVTGAIYSTNTINKITPTSERRNVSK